MLKKYIESNLKESYDKFISRSVLYAQLYLAQLHIMNSDWSNAMVALAAPLKQTKSLCTNQNLIVFILTAMERLMKFAPKGVEEMITLIEVASKEIKPNEERNLQILAFLAHKAFGLGKIGYPVANKIFELLLSPVKLSLSICRTISYLNWDIFIPNAR